MEILIQAMVCEERYKDLCRYAYQRNAPFIYSTRFLKSKNFYQQFLIRTGTQLQKWGKNLQIKGGVEIDKVPAWLYI
jgi:hypothetical protein